MTVENRKSCVAFYLFNVLNYLNRCVAALNHLNRAKRIERRVSNIHTARSA